MQLAVWTQPYVDLRSSADIAPLLDRLAQGGVGLLFPCVKSEVHFTGGKSLAHFSTDRIEESPLGDVLEPLCAEARKRGLAVHPWLCALLEGDSTFLREHPDAACCAFDNLNAEVRTGMACPAHAETRTFVRDIVGRIVEDYDVGGVHLDFIRYPGLRTCACSKCRRDMAREIGARPEDILTSGAARRWWLARRRDNISRLVESASEAAHRSGKEMSAAVFCDYPRALDEVGQDWVDWCRRGLVDIIVPMNYRERLTDFLAAAVEHRALIGDDARILEGIAKTTETVSLSPAELAAQVAAARDLGCAGASIFAARSLTEDDLAALRALR
ncbi:MAG: family 10 glycosylhydrolase [Armatimonadota bacterium]|nr:MAG: family 10 glycosylhydrolase [Armatimonadota bacterium]